MLQPRPASRSVSLVGMLAAHGLVLGVALLLCVGLFSILPLSAAVLAFPLNLLLFVLAHHRLTSFQYAWVVAMLYAGLLGSLILGITVFGRGPFERLLG